MVLWSKFQRDASDEAANLSFHVLFDPWVCWITCTHVGKQTWKDFPLLILSTWFRALWSLPSIYLSVLGLMYGKIHQNLGLFKPNLLLKNVSKSTNRFMYFTPSLGIVLVFNSRGSGACCLVTPQMHVGYLNTWAANQCYIIDIKPSVVVGATYQTQKLSKFFMGCFCFWQAG